MKTRKINTGPALRILTVIIAGLFTTQILTAQQWYSSDWLYRMPVEVQNPGTTHLSGFQVQIILTDGIGGNFDFTKPLSNGSDIRVTSDNGATLIPFWIEGWGAYSESPRQDTIWVKVPNIPSEGSTVYIYYGNTETTITDPPYVPYSPYVPPVPPVPVEMPPSGPFTRAAGNPIVPIDDPYITDGDVNTVPGRGLLAENIVYDEVTGHYWMVFASYRADLNRGVGLVWSDDPADPTQWHWQTGNPVIPGGNAPHIINHNGTWYIFYAFNSSVAVATSSSVSGPYTFLQYVLLPGAAGTWEDTRVDEPYVFQRSDGKWILMYMGDAGGNVEQVSYATADNILGPYTKFGSDPFIPFGPAGSFDAGTVADPWVYEFEEVYYIGYTVSTTTLSPWQTALATTSNWTDDLQKLGVILPFESGSNSFRGAVTRIDDQYVFAYTGDSYDMRIATQPVYVDPADPVNNYTDPVDPLNTIINDPEAVFDFYDGFAGDVLDTDKWTLREPNDADQIVLGGGFLTMTSASTSNYVRINGTSPFGSNYIGETRGRHPNSPATNMIVEYGFALTSTSFDMRITDNFTAIGYWQWYIGSNSGPIGTIPTTQTDFFIYGIYRQSSVTAGFKINASLATPTVSVPTANLRPFLMSFGVNNQFIVDWTRVRKWAGADPVAVAGTEEPYYTTVWTGNTDSDWYTGSNWTNGVPDNTSNILIPDVTNQPVINSATVSEAFCNLMVLEEDATLEIGSAETLIISGHWVNNGGALIQGTGSVVFNGTIQSIGGTSSTTFNNLTIGSTVSTTLGVNTAISGNLAVMAGIFDLGVYTCDRTSAGGTLEVSYNATLKIGGTGTSLPSSFASYVLYATSTVEYAGADQTVADISYNILVLSGSGAKTFPAASTNVIQTLSIRETATALLPDGSESTANILILGGAAPLSGSYGSTSSAAVNQNDTYFTAGYSGIINHNYVPGMWLGATSTNWHDASNWFGGVVPDGTTFVSLQPYADHQPVIEPDSPPAICGPLLISAGASLTISAGEALTVDDDLANYGTLTIESDVFANGSLIVTGTSTGNVIYNRRMNTSGDLYHYFSSPVEALTFPTTGTVWGYDEVTSGWPIETDPISGKGYTLETGIDLLSFEGTLVEDPITIDATSPYRYDNFIDGTELNYDARTFVQSIDLSNSGAVTRSLTNYGGGGWNLLGNPYTSALSVASFIGANYSATKEDSQFDPNYVALYLYNGSTYRWVGLEDGWLNGTGLDADHIQVGQGFFVLAMNDAAEFTFTRSMQEHAPDVLLLKSTRSDNSWPGIMLRAKYGNKENSTLVVYNENMTAGLDPGYDVGQFSSGPALEIYTTLTAKDNGVNFARQALPVADADKILVPIGIDCEAGGEVTFSAMTVPLGNNRFWLEDRLAGVYTDLTLKSYTVTIPEKTFGTGRFFIVASANTPTGTEKLTSEETSLRIWNSYGKVVIKGQVSREAFCELYNMNGQLILKTNLMDGELNTVDLPSGLKGAFLVRIVDGPKITTKKIALL